MSNTVIRDGLCNGNGNDNGYCNGNGNGKLRTPVEPILLRERNGNATVTKTKDLLRILLKDDTG